MWLVLCEAGDYPAQWLADRLSKSKRVEACLVLSGELAACRWHQRLSSRRAISELRLYNGRTIRSEDIDGVINRLLGCPTEMLQRAVEGDRCYVEQEMLALLSSWLYSIDAPVFNRPNERGMLSSWRSNEEWAFHAWRAGITTPKVTAKGIPDVQSSLINTDKHSILAIEERAFSRGIPVSMVGSVIQLGHLANIPMIEVHFVQGALGEWVLERVDAYPDFSEWGDPFVDYLVSRKGRKV